MKLNLREFYQDQSDPDKLKKLYYNMSTTMKYIHEQDYCVKSFNLNDIEILNTENLSPIRYKTVVKMPAEEEEQLTKEDIYNLAFINIGIYSNTLEHLKPQFLKDNFDLFAEFLPEDDVPYYKGIIERGASVYYCDYVVEKTKRQMQTLQKEVGEDEISSGIGIQKSKKTAIGSAFADKETRDLYKGLDDSKQAAFTNFLILPVAMILLGIVLSIILFLS